MSLAVTAAEFAAMTRAEKVAYLTRKHEELPLATPEQIERINAWFSRNGVRATVRHMRATEAEMLIAEHGIA